MTVLILCLIAVLMYAVTWWSTGWGLSPDGFQYERMAQRETVPLPYSRRVALPWFLGHPLWARWPSTEPVRKRWLWWGAVWTILSAVLTATYVGGSLERQVLALLLFVGLPGIWRLNVRLPLLVDPTAYSITLIGALLYRNDHSVLAFLVTCIGVMTKETVPIFVAALSLNPVPLIALGIARYVHLNTPHRKPLPTEPYLEHPIVEARKVHDFFDWRSKLLPWGVLIVLAPLGFTCNDAGISALIALALGYSQLFVAQDNARLYQWAAPAVIELAVQDPPWWIWIAALIGLFNPYRGT